MNPIGAVIAIAAIVTLFVVTSKSGGGGTGGKKNCGLTQAQLDAVSTVDASGLRFFNPDVALGIWRSLASQAVFVKSGAIDFVSIAPTHDGSPIDPAKSALTFATQKNLVEGRYLLVPTYMAFDVACARFIRTPQTTAGAMVFASRNGEYSVLAVPNGAADLIKKTTGVIPGTTSGIPGMGFPGGSALGSSGGSSHDLFPAGPLDAGTVVPGTVPIEFVGLPPTVGGFGPIGPAMHEPLSSMPEPLQSNVRRFMMTHNPALAGVVGATLHPSAQDFFMLEQLTYPFSQETGFINSFVDAWGFTFVGPSGTPTGGAPYRPDRENVDAVGYFGG